MNAEGLKHHIKHLEDQHQTIDKKVDTMEKTGLFEDMDLQYLKKKRLTLKEELERCRHRLADMLK